ncbi:MAG: hypothetical protein WCI89_00775 [bacterium]
MPLPHAFIGEVAGVFSIVPTFFYIRAMLRGETKPDRVTWWILALESGMISASYLATGAHETAWVPLAYTFGSLTCAFFSLKYGEGSFRLHTLDRVSLAGALLSALVWWSLSAPFPALMMNICVDFIGFLPTFIKAYKRPWTEDKTAWIIVTAASLLNLFAVSAWTLAIALYPVYVFVYNSLTLYPIVRNKKKAPGNSQ